MANLVLGTSDTSYATQKLLASVTYRFNRYRFPDYLGGYYGFRVRVFPI